MRLVFRVGVDEKERRLTARPMARIAHLPLVAIVALLGGCSALGPMPELTPGKVMSKEEQQSKVNGMIDSAQNHERDATKQIEGDKTEGDK